MPTTENTRVLVWDVVAAARRLLAVYDNELASSDKLFIACEDLRAVLLALDEQEKEER